MILQGRSVTIYMSKTELPWADEKILLAVVWFAVMEVGCGKGTSPGFVEEVLRKSEEQLERNFNSKHRVFILTR